MKFLLTFLSFCLAFNLSSQVLYSKDSVALGQISDIVDACTKSAKKSIMDVDGMTVKTEQYCLCVCQNIIPKITSADIQKAVNENKMVELLFNDSNKTKILSCLNQNLTIHDNYIIETKSEVVKEYLINECVKNVKKDTVNALFLIEDSIKEYCKCAVNKLYAEGYNYQEISEIENENSISYNEIIVPCLTKFSDKNMSETNGYYPNDIKGQTVFSNISLINYFESGYKVKIDINGVKKYFLFDTGASDLVINSDYEKELILNGTINKSSYIGTRTYTLANNQPVTANLVKVDNIIFGDYVISNVIIAIIQDGDLLCGKSFLEKFKKWELDKETLLLKVFR